MPEIESSVRNYDVYDASLASARAYTAGFNPNLDYMPFTDRFELHLQNWARRYPEMVSDMEDDDD